jgi:protein ImuB
MNPQSLLPTPLYACLHFPPSGEPDRGPDRSALQAIAEQFSPRYERHRDDLVSIDISGLAQLIGPAAAIGEELRREAVARGLRLHVAVAGTRMAAMVLALARPGLTVVARGGEAAALASIRIEALEHLDDDHRTHSAPRLPRRSESQSDAAWAVVAFKQWGLKTLGEVAALPAADLVSRLGRRALAWQAIARGDDIRPLVPTLAEERFESSLELEWPIEEIEPLSFVLTRLLEPLSTRLERRDRGAAVLHVLLRLVTREVYGRRLELPTPLRDVRTLRTLALLDLDAHPAPAAIDCVTVVIDPTPGRVLQHTLFTRAHPTPEQVSTLLARLGALMGQDRFGAATPLDSDRPGAFAMVPFATEHHGTVEPKARNAREANCYEPFAPTPQPGMVSALRRCRQPVPARVAVADGRPVRVTTDRRGFAGGTVTHCVGPWRTSGEWWLPGSDRSDGSDRSERSDGSERSERSDGSDRSDRVGVGRGATHASSWDRDEWDVSLGDGAVYRIFQDRERGGWFVDAIVD